MPVKSETNICLNLRGLRPRFQPDLLFLVDMDVSEEEETEDEELGPWRDDVGCSEPDGSQHARPGVGDQGREDLLEVEDVSNNRALTTAEVDLTNQHLEEECVEEQQLGLVSGAETKFILQRLT